MNQPDMRKRWRVVKILSFLLVCLFITSSLYIYWSRDDAVERLPSLGLKSEKLGSANSKQIFRQEFNKTVKNDDIIDKRQNFFASRDEDYRDAKLNLSSGFDNNLPRDNEFSDSNKGFGQRNREQCLEGCDENDLQDSADATSRIEVPSVTVSETQRTSQVLQTITNNSRPLDLQLDNCVNRIMPRMFSDSENEGYFCLSDDKREYFVDFQYSNPDVFPTSARCFLEGTLAPSKSGPRQCVCKSEWSGQECSIPAVVKNSNYPKQYGVKTLTSPRRIVYAFPFSIEFQLLEARLNELGPNVDAYIILESNYTSSGFRKPRYLLERLRLGYLKEFHDRILYLSLDRFPEKGYKDGWLVEALLRNFIGDHGLSRVRNLQDDDILISTDADEVPVRESLAFLRHHFGYTQPVGFNLRHTIFGFFWAPATSGSQFPSPSSLMELSHSFGACTVAFWRHVLRGELYSLRSVTSRMSERTKLVQEFRLTKDSRVHAWNFGSTQQPAGWHCSWCLDARGVRWKLKAAHVSDTPRWGSVKAKLALSYIRRLIMAGDWFDDTTSFMPVGRNRSSWFVPGYMLRNFDRFQNLLVRNETYIFNH